MCRYVECYRPCPGLYTPLPGVVALFIQEWCQLFLNGGELYMICDLKTKKGKKKKTENKNENKNGNKNKNKSQNKNKNKSENKNKSKNKNKKS
jgi:hypothetical protein